MGAALDRSSLAESAAREYTDLETVRRRLIELEKNRIFSDEDLALLLRKSVSTNLRADFDYRTSNRKIRRANANSLRTSSGRTVIRSWTPAVVEPEEITDDGWGQAESRKLLEEGWKQEGDWKQFEPVRTSDRLAAVPSISNARVTKRPTKLKRLESRNFIITILANLVFIPKQACTSLIGLVVPSAHRSSSRSANRRAC